MYQSIKLSINKLIRQPLLQQTQRSYTTLPLLNTRIHTPHTCTPLCPCHSIKLLQQSIRTTSNMTAMDTSHVESQHDTHNDSNEEVYTNDGWLFGQDPSKPCNDPTDKLFAYIFTISSAATLIWFCTMMYFRPNTSVRQWAREEALARGVYIPPVRPDITDDDEL